MSKVENDNSGVSRRGMITAIGTGTLAAVATAQGTRAEAATGGESFDPNWLTFPQGLERIRNAVAGRINANEIVTSRDPGIDGIVDSLEISNIPSGFVKYQLPVAFEGGPGAQFFISIGHPKTTVQPHSHDEGDGMRFIVSGSMTHEGKELRAGDWMYIPQGASYSFEVGDQGVVLFYCYQCCCA